MTVINDYLNYSKVQSELRIARFEEAIKKLAENQLKRASKVS